MERVMRNRLKKSPARMNEKKKNMYKEKKKNRNSKYKEG